MNRENMLTKKPFIPGKVSVVTPVYNGALFLPHLLNSVLAQTYPDIEMILVDDGSTDNTISVAKTYPERFLKKGYTLRIVKSTHKNASAAINKGLCFVTGEFLIWPDSDDILHPESVEKRVDFLRMSPQYRCVRSLPCYFEEKSGKKLEKWDEERGDLSKEDLFWDILETRTFVCCGCYMVRTETFFGIYPERKIPEYDVGQNFQMLLPFLYRHKCPTIREELYSVCVRPESHSRRHLTPEQAKKKAAAYDSLLQDIADICGITDDFSLNRIALRNARYRCYMASAYGTKKDALTAQIRFLKSAVGFYGIRAFFLRLRRKTL